MEFGNKDWLASQNSCGRFGDRPRGRRPASGTGGMRGSLQRLQTRYTEGFSSPLPHGAAIGGVCTKAAATVLELFALCVDRRHEMQRVRAICGAICRHQIVAILAVVLCAGLVVADEPSQSFPPLEGQRYEIDAPPTLDLDARMRLSLNALTRCVEGPPRNPFPASRYLSEHFIAIGAEPPKVVRSISLFSKAMLATRLARLVTGDMKGIEVDNDWRRGFLDYVQVDPIMHGPGGGRWLEWIAFNIRIEEGANRVAWQKIANNAIDQLNQLSTPIGDAAWIRVGDSPPDDGFLNLQAAKESHEQNVKKATIQSPPEGWDATIMAWTVQGLTALYREAGSRPALELAGKYARYLKEHGKVIGPNGELLAGHEAKHPVVHWHHSFLTAVACAEYGAASGDREFLEFADKAYQHGLSLGNRSIGFVPEYCYGKYPREQSIDDTEACCTSDIVLAALWLTDSGYADYWDDVDRFVRNQLSELQMVDTRWYYDLPENRGRWKFPNEEVEGYIDPLVGNFAGWATLNEWHKPELGCGIMNCCLGNCTRAMFYVWEKMIECDGETLTLHLLLNRASPWADVDGYLPYEGRVRIGLKQDVENVVVRMPEWIPSGSADVVATRGGETVPVDWQGRYVRLKGGPAGTQVSVSFPVPTRTEDAVVGRQPFRLTFKGNMLARVIPDGTRMPMYQHTAYLGEAAPSRRVERFVCNLFVAPKSKQFDLSAAENN